MLNGVDFHMERQRFGNSAIQLQQGFNNDHLRLLAPQSYKMCPPYLDPWSYGDTHSAADELSLGNGNDDDRVVQLG